MRLPAALRPILLWLLFALCAAGGYAIWRVFFFRTPAQQIEALVAKGAKAAEAESVVRLNGIFARDYRDDSGLDRSAILGQAQRFFTEVDELSVRIARVVHEDPGLPPNATAARAVVVLQASGRQTAGGQRFQGIAGNGADVFLVWFENRGGDWQVVRSRRLDSDDPSGMLEALRAP